jgi:hypothetical protein
MLIMDCLHMILFYCKAVNLARLSLERSSASTFCRVISSFFSIFEYQQRADCNFEIKKINQNYFYKLF